MEHLIVRAEARGAAALRGVRAGDMLLSVNGEEIKDQIDYQALTARSRLTLRLRGADGREREAEILKPASRGLGLHFGESMAIKARHCANKCAFCFVDQLPKELRASLYEKDDDWRLSLMMGNYITLTNVSDAEFERILKRKASPLYISVHAADPLLRAKLMGNPNAAHLWPRLERLKEAGLRFHCQIVLCPGLNDGKALDDTLEKLSLLWPAARSAALVPVGLTKHREGLAELTSFTAESARETLDQCARWQERFMETLGTRFVYPADELLALCGAEIPKASEYEDFPQIENGVGLLRTMEDGLEQADVPVNPCPKRKLLATGVSVAPYMKKWADMFAPEVKIEVRAIRNDFFGPKVTVSGLLTGGDLIAQLSDADADLILIPRCCLRAEGDLFLDGVSLDTLRASLPAPVQTVDNDGDALLRALRA